MLEESVPEPFVRKLSLHERLRRAYDSNLLRVITVIKRFDADGSGDIGCNEFATLVRELVGMHDVDEGEVHALFSSFDRDGSGAISLPEITKSLKSAEALGGTQWGSKWRSALNAVA